MDRNVRIILYTGKGGVGKTSVAAATALRCADLGYRTVVLSTDAAHSLSDSFDTALGPEPVEVNPGLFGQEIDVLYQMEKHWGKVQEYMASVLAWRGMDDLIAEEASVLPGMEELASLLQIVHMHDDYDYDVIIVDCAPTGATLRLLSFPEVARWYLEKIFPVERAAMKVGRPLLRAMVDLPLPDDDVFDAVADLIMQLHRMHRLLSDAQKSSIRLVLNLEKMVIKEAQRAFTYLNLYGYPTDLIISNRVIPDDVKDGHLASWKGIQEKYSRMVEEGFSPLPILKVPFFDQEVVGLDMLRRMAESIYGQEDPTQVYFIGQTQTVEKCDGGYLLSLPLPFVDKGGLDLTRSGDELIIHIGNQKRNLILPRALINMEVQSAKLKDGVLKITFAEENGEAAFLKGNAE
jgi:arsenite-transporting ATPase